MNLMLGLYIIGSIILLLIAVAFIFSLPVRQTEYGIKLVSVAAGALKLKDELKFEFDLVGRKE